MVFAGFGKDAEIVKVRARGVGPDKVEALKDAYLNAIEQAVGLYIDAERMVANASLVKNQITVQSNAYINKHKVVSEEVLDNGLISVTILAEVRNRALTKRLHEVMPPTTTNLSDSSLNLHARIVAETKADDDARTIIRNELEGLHPLKHLIRASVAGKDPIRESVEGDPSLVRLWYPIRFEVDTAKYYKTFVPRWVRLLDQIKVAPAKRIDMKNNLEYIKAYKSAVENKFGTVRKKKAGVMTRCEKKRDLSSGEYYDQLKIWGLSLNEEYSGVSFFDAIVSGKSYALHGTGDDIRGFCSKRGDHWGAAGVDIVPVSNIGRIQSYFRSTESWSEWAPEISEDCEFQVGIISKAYGNALSGKIYKLPYECVREIYAWQRRLAGDVQNSEYEEAPVVTYTVSFADAGGNEIIGTSFAVRCSDVMNFACTLLEDQDSDGNGGSRLWLITPLVGGFAKSYVKWVSIDILKDDVAKIASATVTVED